MQFFDFFFLPVNLKIRSGRKHRAMSNPPEHSEIPEPLVAALRRARRVVVLTGSGLARDRTEAQKLGAVGYEIKPVDFNALLDIVHSIGTRWLTMTEG